MHTRATIYIAFLIILSLFISPSSGQATVEELRPPAAESLSSLVPELAQAVVSSTIGRDEAEFHFTPSNDGFTAHSSTQSLQAHFDTHSALVDAQGVRWDMRLQAWGYGSSPAGSVCAESPVVSANRLEYHCEGITEWYINGPLGIEQGFTVSEPPAPGPNAPRQAGGQPLGFVLSLGENQAKIESAARDVTLIAPSGAELRYAGLLAFDAHGKELPAWFEINPENPQILLIRVDDHDAKYPLTVDPLVQAAKLSPTDSLDNQYGYSVAISSSGREIFVGAYGADQERGAVYEFYSWDDGTSWSFVKVYRASYRQQGAKYGYSIAIAQSSPALIIGAPGYDHVGKTDVGAAYIYYNPVSPEVERRFYGENAHDYFGHAVSMNKSGDIALVGAYGFDVDGKSNQGKVYTIGNYVQYGDWVVHREVTPVDGKAGDYFGYSLAFTNETTAYAYTYLVGAPKADINGKSNQGAAYMFDQDQMIKKFTASDGAAEDWFGRSVALGNNADVALVGAYQADISGKSNQGAVYSFVKNSSSWVQGKITAADGAASDLFGISVAVSEDGLSALVGAHMANVSGASDQGAAYYFTRSGNSTWTQQAKLVAADGGSVDQFGIAVALNGDATRTIIGANRADWGGSVNHGGAYIFTRSGTTWTQIQETAATKSKIWDPWGGRGATVSLSEDGSTMLVGLPYWGDGRGAVFVFALENGIWVQKARLESGEFDHNAAFGCSLDINADGSKALIGAPWVTVGSNEDQGAAYLFTRSGSTWTQAAKLTASDGVDSEDFGISVAINDAGTTALVGARDAEIGSNKWQGAAYVYIQSGSNWTQQVKLITSDGAQDDSFGSSVSLSADGNTALIGAFWDDIGGNYDQGSAYIFTRSGTTWTQKQQLTAADGESADDFGDCVAISADGLSALVGASRADIGSNGEQGAAYLYKKSGETWVFEKKFNLSAASPDALFGWSVAISQDGTVISVGAPGRNNSSGAVYIYKKEGATWSAAQEYFSTDLAADDYFGASVSLAPNGLIFAAAAPGTNERKGGAYYFERLETTTMLFTVPDPTVYGEDFGLRVDVNAYGAMPQGKVEFRRNGVYMGEATLSVLGRAEYLVTGNTSVGTHTYSADFIATDSFYASSDTDSHTITRGSTTITVTEIVYSPSSVGQAVEVFYRVDPVAPANFVPGGTVTIHSNTGETCIGPLDAGAGSCTLTFTNTGLRTLIVWNSGSVNYNNSTVQVTHTVNKAASGLWIISHTPDPVLVGEPVSVGIELLSQSPTAGPAYGTVTVTDNNGATCYLYYPDSTSCDLIFTSPGTKTITATYSGSSNHNPSSDTETHTVNAQVVNKYPTSVTVTSDNPDPSLVGQPVTVTFTVALSSGIGPIPDGSVAIYDDDGGTCRGTLSHGHGSCTLILPTAGRRTLRAEYNGGENFWPSTKDFIHDVNKINTRILITSHTPDPVEAGQPVNVTVDVDALEGGSQNVLGVVVISGSDGNSCTFNLKFATGCALVFSSSGTKTITATFLETSIYKSASVTAAHTVDPVPIIFGTTTTISAHSPDPSLTGQEVQVDVVVAAKSFSPVIITGDVIVSDSGGHTCTAKLHTGSGSCMLLLTNTGTIRIFANYPGSSTLSASSTVVNHRVMEGETTTTITNHAPNPSAPGESIPVTVSVISNVSGMAVPNGTVTVSDDEGNTCQINLESGQSCLLELSSSGEKTITAIFTGSDTFKGSYDSISHLVSGGHFVYLPLVVR